MKQLWSSKWNASTQPRKQRKYRHNASLHTRQTFLHVHLSKDLQKKYNMRRLGVRTGDKVKIFRGDNKGKEAKVSKVDVKNVKVFIEGMERIKMDGSKVQLSFEPSNLMIMSLGKVDRRIKKKASQTEGKE